MLAEWRRRGEGHAAGKCGAGQPVSRSHCRQLPTPAEGALLVEGKNKDDTVAGHCCSASTLLRFTLHAFTWRDSAQTKASPSAGSLYRVSLLRLPLHWTLRALPWISSTIYQPEVSVLHCSSMLYVAIRGLKDAPDSRCTSVLTCWSRFQQNSPEYLARP